MFGIKVVKQSEWDGLQESMTRYERELEDIGWINLTTDPGQQGDVIIGNFKKMIRACRVLYFNNPLAGHWVNLTTAFTIGEGIPKPKAKDAQIQKVIDEFWDDIDNQMAFTSFQAQQLLCNKLQYEGNLWPVMFEDETGKLKLRFLNTEEVDDVIRDEEDRMRTIFYKVGQTDRKYDFMSHSYAMAVRKFVYYPDASLIDTSSYKIRPGELMDAKVGQVKINCDINDKFGVPELYRGLDWVKAHKSSMEDMATLGRALAQFAWKKKVKGGPAQVASIAANLKSNMNLTNIRNSAGQTQVENDGIDLQSIDVKTGGMDVVVKSGREQKLMVCAASGIFEHYYGDPSTGNLATSKSMELPMVKKFSCYQSLWRSVVLGILNYQIDRKVEAGMLPGSVDEDLKTGRKIVTTTLDRTIDLMFPSIVEDDIKQYAEAMGVAQEKNLVSQKTAAKLFLTTANVEDIDDELTNIETDMAEKERKQQEQFEREAGMQPPGKPGAEDDDEAQGKGKVPVKEAEGVTGETLRQRLEARHQKKVNYVIQQMNGYRKQLRGHLKTLTESARKAGKVHQVRDKFTFHVPSYSEMVTRFTDGMQESAQKYFPIAVQIGEKHMQSMLKIVKPSFRPQESLYEAQGKATSILRNRLQWNQTYLTENFHDALLTSMDKAARDVYLSEEAAWLALNEAVTKFEPRVEQYVGAFWTTEEEAVKEAGRGSGVMVNFIGPDDEENCDGCQEGIEGNPWKIEDAPIPGEQDCLGRCRHALQIITEE